MKILIIGNGGREHAIASKILHSPSFRSLNGEMFCTYPNPGLAEFCKEVRIKPDDIIDLLEFAKSERIDLTVVGPEIPLSLGIVDLFSENNLKIFGPTKAAAELETSKIFAKEFMMRNKIPTAKFNVFDGNNYTKARDFIKTINYPAVIKADGLAAGKGVCIASDTKDAEDFIKEITEMKVFGESGEKFIIEEYLEGFELSIFAITDGRDYIILPSAQDHKKIGEGDTGKNTGGMGSYAPADSLIDNIIFEKIENKIILPTITAMSNEGRRYKGCLYCGLMIIKKGGISEPYVIEYNCRFGDPETQSVLPLIKSDFLELLIASTDDNIKDYNLETEKKFSGCVVAASKGYPDKYETGKEIIGLKQEEDDKSIIYQAGTKFSEDKNSILTSGGRVLNVVGISEISVKDALKKAYTRLEKIHFENIYYRKDIGFRFPEDKTQ